MRSSLFASSETILDMFELLQTVRYIKHAICKTIYLKVSCCIYKIMSYKRRNTLKFESSTQSYSFDIEKFQFRKKMKEN